MNTFEAVPQAVYERLDGYSIDELDAHQIKQHFNYINNRVWQLIKITNNPTNRIHVNTMINNAIDMILKEPEEFKKHWLNDSPENYIQFPNK